MIHDVRWLSERHEWPGLKAVVVVESSREINGKTEHEARFYRMSLVMVAALLGPVARSHWAIENSLHWVMDMMFRDDECRVRTDHAPANFTTIKHVPHNLLRTAAGRICRPRPATLHEIGDLAMHNSIDDFGTGYSSLAHLQRIPMDTIKSDRVFVCNMTESRDDSAMVNAIIDIATTLCKHVSAEGVDT